MGNAKSKREREIRERDMAERRERKEDERIKKEADYEKQRKGKWSRQQISLFISLNASATYTLPHSPHSSHSSHSSHSLARRKKIGEEILNTEKSYINSL